VLPGGKIVLAGSSFNGTDDDFAVARYNADGSLDATFAKDGILLVPISPGEDDAYDLAVRPDGTIVVVGTVYDGTDIDAGLVIIGTEASDSLQGGAGEDVILGFAGRDTLNGAGGEDVMEGGAGSDTYRVGGAGDEVSEAGGGGRADTVIASIDYVLDPGVEILRLIGRADDGTGNGLRNLVIGNDGDNVLNGLGGVDTMRGAFGDDIYYVDNFADVVIETANDAPGGLVLPGSGSGQAGPAGITDTVIAAVNYAIGQFVENLRLIGEASRGTGNGLSNRLTGNAGSDTLDGGGGNDTLDGGAGSDRLLGGSQNDMLVWGAGDRLDGGGGSDTVRPARGDLDLTNPAINIRNVETVNMNGAGANALTLTGADLLEISPGGTLTVLGGVGDTVNALGFTRIADLRGYNRYTSGAATLLVETDVTVN
jgi:uncharacterized delta-60 repeat protein